VIFAIFTKVCRVFYHFCRDFLLSLHIVDIKRQNGLSQSWNRQA